MTAPIPEGYGTAPLAAKPGGGRLPLRVYPSALDGFEYYTSFVENKTPETLDKYVKDLTGQSPPNEAMERGTLFHKGMEDMAKTGRWDCPIGWDIDVELPRPVYAEKPLFMTRKDPMAVRGYEVMFSGKVDAMYGNVIVDYKTTEKSIQLEKYMDSWQWRAYLTMWGAAFRTFRYDIFKLKRRKGEWFVDDHQDLVCTAYEGMEAEVWGIARRFSEFVLSLQETGRLKVTPEGRLRPA